MTTISSGELDAPGSNDARSLLRNAGVLFAGQAVATIAPLLTVPYLARVLGPSGWGPVLAAQGFAYWMILVLEFGFDLSGARDVARARTVPQTIPDVVHGVQSAKATLVLLSIPVVLLAVLLIPALRRSPQLLTWAFLLAVFRGTSPLWFFQGVERLHGAVAVDTVTRALAAFGVFAVVHSPADGWWVIALQAAFAAISLAVLTWRLSLQVPLRWPRLADARRTLRGGSSIFACRAWSGLYIQGNAMILAALASPATVAFFGGAERIIRGAINLLQPLTQAFLPRVSYLQASDPPAAERVIRRSLVGVGLLGVAMGTTALVAAPVLVHVLLGHAYEAAIPVLRVMALLPVLIAVNTVLGIYWALPFGHERAFLVSIVAAGITNLMLAALLVPPLGALGMAIAAIAAEVVVLGCLGTLHVASQLRSA